MLLFTLYFSLAYLLQSSLASSLEGRALCTKDNCLNPVESAGVRGSTDCSSYLQAIATPYTLTTVFIVTSTVTGIETIWVPSVSYSIWQSTSLVPSQTPLIETQSPPLTSATAAPVKRDILPRNASATIPAYASACSPAASYLSACSCVGVSSAGPQSTLTITVSTTTTTKTIPTATHTSTATFVREVCGPQNNYGFIYNSISWFLNNTALLPNSVATFRYPTFDHHTCCAACYQQGGPNGCYFYWMDLAADSGICELAIVDAVTPGVPPNLLAFGASPPSPHCPNGVTEAIDTTPGNLYGAGPCLDGWLKTAY